MSAWIELDGLMYCGESGRFIVVYALQKSKVYDCKPRLVPVGDSAR